MGPYQSPNSTSSILEVASFNPQMNIIGEVFRVPIPIGNEVRSRGSLLVFEQREVKATPIFGGTQRVQKNLIGRL